MKLVTWDKFDAALIAANERLTVLSASVAQRRDEGDSLAQSQDAVKPLLDAAGDGFCEKPKGVRAVVRERRSVRTGCWLTVLRLRRSVMLLKVQFFTFWSLWYVRQAMTRAGKSVVDWGREQVRRVVAIVRRSDPTDPPEPDQEQQP